MPCPTHPTYHILLNKGACLNKRAPDFWRCLAISQKLVNWSHSNFQHLMLRYSRAYPDIFIDSLDKVKAAFSASALGTFIRWNTVLGECCFPCSSIITHYTNSMQSADHMEGSFGAPTAHKWYRLSEKWLCVLFKASKLHRAQFASIWDPNEWKDVAPSENPMAHSADVKHMVAGKT